MEDIRRALKVFWTEHGTPILFWIIVIAVIFVIIQILNFYAIKNNQQKGQGKTEIKASISKEENIKNKDIISNFVEFCNKGKIQEAYELLSENCKKELYPTIDKFKENYYKKIFTQTREIEIQLEDKNVYKVTFYEDILESGKIENRNSIVDYYQIEQEILEDKLYINIKENIK